MIIKYYFAISFQEPLCDNDSAGRECAAKVPKSLGTPCITPCKGLYADVKKTPYIDKGFSSDALHENYSQYKRFNEEEIEFPSDLKSHLIYYIINVLIIFLLRFSVQDKLYCGQNIF